MNWLEWKSKDKNKIKDFNMVLKDIWTGYRLVNNIAIPANMSDECIKNKKVFLRSCAIWTGSDGESLDYLDNCMIDPVMLNRGISDNCKEIKTKDNCNYLFDGKSKEEYLISTNLNDKDIKDSLNYTYISLIDDYRNHQFSESSSTWYMDDMTKEELLDYRTIEINIGEDNDKGIYLIATLKLFPAIKKADDICIVSEPRKEDNMYDITIISKSKCFVVITQHTILNF